MPQQPWDGITERRSKPNDRDHDILVKIDNNLDYLVKEFEEHKKSDDVRFEKLDKRTGWIEKVCYMGIGILAFIQFIWKK